MLRNFIFFLLCIHPKNEFRSNDQNNHESTITDQNSTHYTIQEKDTQPNRPTLPIAIKVSSTLSVKGQPYHENNLQSQNHTDIMIHTAIGRSFH